MAPRWILGALLAGAGLFAGCDAGELQIELVDPWTGEPVTPGDPSNPGPPADGGSQGAPEPTYARVLHVGPDGSDGAAGTQGAPFRTLRHAVTQLEPGDALFVRSGTYAERLDLGAAVRDGEPGRPITVRAAPGATVWLKGGTGASGSMIKVSRAHWTFDGINVDAAGDPAFAVLFLGAGAHHGVVRNAELKNGTTGAGVNVAEFAHDVLVEGCHIHHFVKPGDDSHGVILQTTSRNVVVRRSDIHHNSGDSVQCIGPEGGATRAGTPFDNLLVEDSDLHENRENGVDIKTCTNVTLRRNRIWGHRMSTTSRGEGVVIHLSARNVRLEDNELWGNGRGVSIGGIREGAPPTNVALVRNRIHSGVNANGEDGIGVRIDTAVDVRLLHNTLWGFPGPALQLGSGDSGNSDLVSVKNNLIAQAPRLVRMGASRSRLTFEHNLYYRSAGPAILTASGEDFTLGAWRGAFGLDTGSVEANPLLAAPPLDVSLLAGSPARDSGVSLGLPFCGSAPDIGALEAGCR